MDQIQFLQEIESSIAVMKARGVTFAAGLSVGEIEAVERRFRFQFPPDLRAFLRVALPRGGRFPDWRLISESEALELLRWPEDGIAFDVEHNSIWLPEWGPRPRQMDVAIDKARRLVQQAPTLIPVHGHRYIPSEPPLAGNAVFSVSQTDIIVYGSDLWDYFRNDFAPRDDQMIPGSVELRRIRFWSEFIDSE